MSDSFICSTCGDTHTGAPLSWGPDAPKAWAELALEEREKHGELGTDQCVLDDQRFFIRGRIEILVIDTQQIFAWLVWAEVNPRDFISMSNLWTTEGREKNAPIYDARIANELPIYEKSISDVSVKVHTRPVGQRPFFEVSGDHQVRDEQRNGISSHYVQQIANTLLSQL
jgi:hypothetical protein